MERMRTNVATVVLDLRRALRGEFGDPDSDDSSVNVRTPPLQEILVRAFVGYYVAAMDAEENVWGAASMCLVSLGLFCDTLQSLRQHDARLSERMGEEVEASRMDLQMQIQDDNE